MVLKTSNTLVTSPKTMQFTLIKGFKSNELLKFKLHKVKADDARLPINYQKWVFLSTFRLEAI